MDGRRLRRNTRSGAPERRGPRREIRAGPGEAALPADPGYRGPLLVSPYGHKGRVCCRIIITTPSDGRLG